MNEWMIEQKERGWERGERERERELELITDDNN